MGVRTATTCHKHVKRDATSARENATTLPTAHSQFWSALYFTPCIYLDICLPLRLCTLLQRLSRASTRFVGAILMACLNGCLDGLSATPTPSDSWLKVDWKEACHRKRRDGYVHAKHLCMIK